MVKIPLVVGAVALLCAGEAAATPEPGHWRRESPIGVSGDSYFVWVSSWGQDGLNHQYEESAELQRRLFADNSVVESDTLYSAKASNIDAPYDWKVTRNEHPSLEVAGYLRDREVSPVFAGDWLCDCTILEDALVLSGEESTATVLSAEELRLQVPALGRDPCVGGCWYVSDGRGSAPGEFWIFSVRYNSASWDDDWAEVLVVLPGKLIRKAAAQLGQGN